MSLFTFTKIKCTNLFMNIVLCCHQCLNCTFKLLLFTSSSYLLKIKNSDNYTSVFSCIK